MIKAFFIAHKIDGMLQARAVKHCQTLANRYGFHVIEIFKNDFYIVLITSVDDDSFTENETIHFSLGQIVNHPTQWDRFLKIKINSVGLLIENDYAGSIPVFYSQRNGFVLSNIEPCVFLGSGSSLKDLSPENLYGFLRYSHFIWDETAWSHIKQMLPDSRYQFASNGELLSVEYLETVKATNARNGLSDKQVADELFELNRMLVHRSLADAEDIILPLSSGYDSRMIFAVLANDKELLRKTRCFTYGPQGSIEVESGRRLAMLKGVEWHHIDLPCCFLTQKYLEDISDIFGASLHMHGMYQLEFLDEIQTKFEVLTTTRFTSGFMTGVPAGQHNGLLQINEVSSKLTEAMNRFSQSKVWLDEDLDSMPIFRGKKYTDAAEARFRKAFDRFDGEIYQKAVMFDVWTRQRNFISYYPRVFEWMGSVASPHMCQEYANFFMSLNRDHLWNRKAVELMFLFNYPDISGIASNSNGLKTLNRPFENGLFFASRVLRKLSLPNPLPHYYHDVPIEFNLQAVHNCHEDSVYPLLADYTELSDFMDNFGGPSVFRKLYTRAEHGDSDGYERLITFQAVALNSLLTARYGG